LSLGKNKIILSGLVSNTKTNEPIAANISFQSDSAYTAVSSTIGQFERTLPRTKYKIKITAPDYIDFSDVIDLTTTEPVLVSKEFKLQTIERGTVVSMRNVLFYMGTTNLLEDSFAELDAVAIFLKSNPKVKIELNGHTDNQGDAKKDIVLSQQRVDRIKEYLVSKGVSARRISGKGFGGTKPVASNANEDGRKLNRRVEFVILKK
jgi:outer membrane protein OmpA-like peptidoglycan-associated protein